METLAHLRDRVGNLLHRSRNWGPSVEVSWNPRTSRTLDEWRLIRQVQWELNLLRRQKTRAEAIDRQQALNAIAKELRADDVTITKRIVARREVHERKRSADEVTRRSMSVAEHILGL